MNNFWETSGLNILETLARLDHESVPQLIDNLLSVRTNISTIFIRTAFRQHPDKAQEVLATANEVADHADAFAELDYNIFRGLAFASGNPIYGLILNAHWSSLFRQSGSAQSGAGFLPQTVGIVQ